MAKAFYNDNDKFCCEWLQNLIDAGLIMAGVVSDKPIQELKPEELAEYDRVHLFAGIGGWDYALQLAGWPEGMAVWTGSCPCQPFSVAGKKRAQQDERHLWPEMLRLVRECRPPVVFGEQVASAIRHGWLDGVQADLEAEGYSCGAAVLGAHSLNSPHIRQRLCWVAVSASARLSWGATGNQAGAKQQVQSGGSSVGWLGSEQSAGSCVPCGGCGNADPVQRCVGCLHDFGLHRTASRLADADTARRTEAVRRERVYKWVQSEQGRGELASRFGNGVSQGLEGRESQPGDDEPQQSAIERASCDAWGNFRIIHCRDGKARRVSAQPGDEPLAHGIPRKLGPEFSGVGGMAKRARSNRVGRLRGYGNSIVPQVAAGFVLSFMEATSMKEITS